MKKIPGNNGFYYYQNNGFTYLKDKDGKKNWVYLEKLEAWNQLPNKKY